MGSMKEDRPSRAELGLMIHPGHCADRNGKWRFTVTLPYGRRPEQLGVTLVARTSHEAKLLLERLIIQAFSGRSVEEYV